MSMSPGANLPPVKGYPNRGLDPVKFPSKLAQPKKKGKK